MPYSINLLVPAEGVARRIMDKRQWIVCWHRPTKSTTVDGSGGKQCL